MHEWSRPTIHTTTGHRQASWIELFFDLVFIASLVEAIHFVEAHLSEGIMSTLLLFLVFFIAPWIVWRSTTFYSDRYEENTSRHRLLLIVLMMPIGLFAYSVHHVVEEHVGWFVLSFILSRLWLLFMWGTVRMTEEAQRRTFRILLLGHGMAMLLVTFSYWIAFLPLVLLALLIELFQTLWTLRAHEQLPELTRNHLPERFGLFTMLVLGEGVLGVIDLLAAGEGLLFPFLLFLYLVFCFWIYYDQVIYRLYHPTAWHVYWWGMWNLGIVISLLLVRSAFSGYNATDPDAVLLFFSATLLFIWTTGGIGLTGQKDTVSVRMTRRFLQLRLLLTCLLIGSFFILPPLLLLLVMLLTLLLILFQGIYYWTTLLRPSSET